VLFLSARLVRLVNRGPADAKAGGEPPAAGTQA